MIDRYAFEPMKSLWCDKKKYDSWLKVELAVCEVRKELGL